MIVYLSDLDRGEEALVEGFHEEEVELARLRDMGLSDGTKLRIIKFAPFRDSVEIKLRDSFLFVRRSTAKCIKVRRIEKGTEIEKD